MLNLPKKASQSMLGKCMPNVVFVSWVILIRGMAMSLNFKLDKIKNYETVTRKGDELNPVTNALIWSTMSVGLGSITEKNLQEWLVRLAFSDKLFGTMLKKDGEDRPFTRDELVAHIGLSCNVCDESRVKWTKRMTEHFMREAEYKLKKAA